LRDIDGFNGCTTLRQIEIPSSVERIGRFGFRRCGSLSVVMMSAECQLTTNKGFRQTRSFIIYEDENDVKERRSLIHLGNVGRR
jgi:hypothetical protein